MKIASITFHGSYNYGSMLQTYALEKYIEDIVKNSGENCEFKVINYRTKLQKDIYNRPKFLFAKSFVKYMMEVPYFSKMAVKRKKFESFLKDFVNLTEECNSENDLGKLSEGFDVFISGSDQIWNVRARDFSFAYLLNFTNKKKISYAVSLGPLDIDWSKYDRERYISALKEYSYISVREEGSKKMIDDLLGNCDSIINVDPTLLLDVEQWRKIQSNYNCKMGKYILFYCLEPNVSQLDFAKKLSKRLSIPVVITGYRNRYDYFNGFVKCYDAGPLDFLSLIDKAELVLTSSFHGTVFSIIYEKKFLVINDINDNRITSLMKTLDICNCSIKSSDNANEIEINDYDYKKIKENISFERQRSQDYLKKALGLI